MEILDIAIRTIIIRALLTPESLHVAGMLQYHSFSF